MKCSAASLWCAGVYSGKIDSENQVAIKTRSRTNGVSRTPYGRMRALCPCPPVLPPGHAEGSRAFNRYREIDFGMKQDLVKILENKKG